jgi:hypothetical protein
MDFNKWRKDVEDRSQQLAARMNQLRPVNSSSLPVSTLNAQVPSVKSPKAENSQTKKLKAKSSKIYLAGRVSKNDWRHDLVEPQEGSAGPGLLGLEEWHKAVALEMVDGNAYVGPFFIDCDHACCHGTDKHGAISVCTGKVSRSNVFEKALKGIKDCDLFFAWAGKDFGEAYGTLVEIGLAHSLRKRIVIAHHPSLVKTDQHGATGSHWFGGPQWFAFECADEVIAAEDPILAYEQVEKYARVS